MTNDEPGHSDLWIRLRNHALQYVGVGWFLTQVFAVAGRRFGWPAGVGDTLVIALGVGFIAVMLGSFVMARRAGRAASAPRKLPGLALAAIAAVAALVVWLAQGDPEAGPAGLVSASRGLFSTSSNVDGFFVVHPQKPLTPTGVFVAGGQTISMWGEGSINLALARLVEAAEIDDAVAYEWVGPQGEVDARGQPVIRRDRARPGRERCLLTGSAPYGALLALLTPSDRVSAATVRSLVIDRDLFVVGTHLETTAQSGGYLTIAVNDVYLDREECDPEEFAGGRSPGAYYRDNIGFFTVRLQIR